MKIKKRKILFEQTERQISFAVRFEQARFFCAACGGQSEMISINDAARRAGTDWRVIVRRIEAGSIHATETETGAIYVCAASLSNGI